MQDANADPVASIVPSVGTVEVEATQTAEATATAEVRVRHSVDAVSTAVGETSMTRDRIRVPIDATQAATATPTAQTRARYTLDATQQAAAAQTAKATPVLGATQAATTDSTGTARGRHTINAASSAVASATATAEAVNIKFDNVAIVEGSATTNFDLTVGANATIIVFVAGNVTNAARVDGVPMTLVGKTGNAAMYYATGLAAGARNVQVDRSGSSGHIVSAVSYTGVSAVVGGALGSGTSAAPAGTPTGSGNTAVTGFDFSAGSAEINNVTSNGTLRARYRRTSGNCLAVADRQATPVQLSTPSSGSWTSISVWLA